MIFFTKYFFDMLYELIYLYVVFTIDSDLYPVQFTYHSKDKANIPGQPIKVGDTGFLHILSSAPRKTFWGQGITQLMSVDNMGKIGVSELGPKPHTPISKGI